ncbi:unnamed protein product [Vitrella brassicaformis CCMP3155]|uniref:Uncharacterized protein n=1 Tax=Vitrella brassicaformis (strain CCMP3155) TaxID=1169540 RepID=A0A0G4EKM3_VITBC|nr:unnamed protein product [Vitrella brassicaformis CCMP3155]|eukprot:CEL96974.1 unnamed protein product [Vitrella brassicaformis CCMP3155]
MAFAAFIAYALADRLWIDLDLKASPLQAGSHTTPGGLKWKRGGGKVEKDGWRNCELRKRAKDHTHSLRGVFHKEHGGRLDLQEI